RLKELGLIDGIIAEPLGGAHRDIDATISNVKQTLLDTLDTLCNIPIDKLMEQRYTRLMQYGNFAG
ncbi:MAG: acetyl-CoA carboxylase carboxyl transferase subunit alpha, partial [Gammaproteobacteria bacterium]